MRGQIDGCCVVDTTRAVLLHQTGLLPRSYLPEADVVPGCPPLARYVSFYLEKLDTRYVEEEALLGHPRDPFHRVDARRSSRHVVVRAGGEIVTETNSPVAKASRWRWAPESAPMP